MAALVVACKALQVAPSSCCTPVLGVETARLLLWVQVSALLELPKTQVALDRERLMAQP